MDDEERLCVAKFGRQWGVGTAEDVAWIMNATEGGRSITSAIPPIYDSYATVVIASEREQREKEFLALHGLLRQANSSDVWWQGFLDTGSDDVVFPEVEPVRLYAGWPYHGVIGSLECALEWRTDRLAWRGPGPDLLFPVDRSLIVSWLWDDDWLCIGASSEFVEAVLHSLPMSSRRVQLGEDATPPGHTSF